MRGEEAPVEDRMLKINGSLAFIEHAFLGNGHMEQLRRHEMGLRVFVEMEGEHLP